MPATADAIVLFGATGDLARRMLLPSLYFLDADGFLPRDFRLIATARAELSTEEFLDQTHKALSERPEGVDDAVWARFSQRIVYVGADATTPEGAAALKPALEGRRALFFLAVSPSLFD